VDLLDLHIVWIVRHLFMRRFGRWPGRQILHTAHERLMEHQSGELCGCDAGRRYEECCRGLDERLDPVGRAISFVLKFGTADRRPPNAVSEFVYGYRKTPPSLRDLRFLDSFTPVG
jgi:hypothetical protein